MWAAAGSSLEEIRVAGVGEEVEYGDICAILWSAIDRWHG